MRVSSLILTAKETTGFIFMASLFAIFFDAAVAHGLTWENDPYWTYWITKTFLIAAVLGLGTAWFGAGVGRGAIYTAVHTLILTIYYWTLSPVGMPSSPEWLDFEHTWLTGTFIHFGVIYLGYLTALWLVRRQMVGKDAALYPSNVLGVAALIVGAVITILAGGIASLILGEFPGFTWSLVRLLLTVPFLFGWWSVAGRDMAAAITGGIILAFIWTAYSQYLGPVGLPDLPLRIFDKASPGSTVHWLSYRQLYAVSLPVYIVVMEIILIVYSSSRRRATV